MNEEPFWIQAQTNLIRWIRNGHRLAGEPEPGIRSVAETAGSRTKLEALVKKALCRAETTDDLTEARELERWLTHNWLPLDAALTSRLTTTLAEAGARAITVTSRDGTLQTRLGERTGSWDSWEPASLPKNACRAARTALAELRGESPWTIQDNPKTASRTRGTGPRPERTGFEVITASIDTIEQAAKSTKTAGRRLKNNLTHQNNVGNIPDRHETELRTRALKAAEKLETVATALHREMGRLAGPEASRPARKTDNAAPENQSSRSMKTAQAARATGT